MLMLTFSGTLSSSFSTTLEVIIEPTAAESNKPYVVSVLPFSAVTLSGTTLSISKLFLLCSVVALFTNILDTAGELGSALALTCSISFFVETCNSEW